MKTAGALMLIWMVILFTGCGTAGQMQYPEQRLRITVMQTADIRGELSGTSGSFAQAAQLIEDVRSRNEHTILIDTGNFAGGSGEAYLSGVQQSQQPHVQAALMRGSRFDAALLGARELGYSTTVYQRIRQDAHVPWVGANIVNRSTGAPHVTPYRIIERGSSRIALLGLTHQAAVKAIPERLIPGIDLLDVMQQASYWVPRIIEEEAPDALILAVYGRDDALFRHSAFAQPPSSSPYRALIAEVVAQVPGIDAVLANIDDRGFDELLIGPDGKGVPIVNPASRGQEVGVLELELFSPRGSDAFTELAAEVSRKSTKDLSPSAAVTEILRPYQQRLDTYLARSIGSTDAALTTRDAFFFDAPLMELIHRVQRSVTGAHVSFASPPGKDITIGPGTLLVEDVFTLFPHESYVVALRMTGSEIARYLEYSYAQWFTRMNGPYDNLVDVSQTDSSGFPLNWHRFDTAGGLRYTYDAARPSGDRIRISGFTDGRTFRREETYIVAMNSYRAAGGGGHVTDGVGLSREEIQRRIVSSSIRDVKQQLITWLEREGRFTPREEPSWYVVPEAWGAAGYLNDYPLLFGDTPQLR